MIDHILRFIYSLEDYIFSRFGRLDFSGVLLKNQLGVCDNKLSFADMTAFQSVWCRNLRYSLAVVNRQFPIKFDYFIDIGSGKGKACFYAERLKVAQKYVGIDLSQHLVDVAKRNKSLIRGSNVHFEANDATEYLLPDASCILFLFNPFGAAVLRRFCENNRSAFQRNHIALIYVNDKQREVLRDHFEVVFRDDERQVSVMLSKVGLR